MRFTIKRLTARKRWRLEYRLNGERFRPSFKTKELAEAEQERVEQQVSKGGAAWLALTGSERTELMTVFLEVQEAGKTLREVWEEYQRRAAGKELKKITLAAAFAQFMAERAHMRLSKPTIKKYRSNVGRFVTPRAAMLVSAVARQDVVDYLQPYRDETFNTYRTSLSVFFNWCVKLKFAEESPLSAIETIDRRRMDNDGPPGVLHYKECLALLKATLEIDRGMIRYVAVCLLAGLRPDREALLLCPGDITDRLHVRGKTAKDRQERYVEIVPALREWLAFPLWDAKGPRPALQFQGPAGSDWPIVNRRKRFDAIRLKAGLVREENDKLVGWHQDCMRHTFASAFYAVYGAERTIEAMGHGDYESLFGHYRKLMTKEEGQRILSITPAMVNAAKL